MPKLRIILFFEWQFYEELESEFYTFPKRRIKLLLWDLDGNAGRENIYKIGNGSLQEITSDNGARILNFNTSENLIVKSTMFPLRNINKFTWTSPAGKTQSDRSDFER
jgi:hypothetical protein